jgi:glutamate-1-semialdehyde 2,1-aminomutase
MTGYRAHFGGAQTLYDIQPDLTCLGKVIGGGFPVGAFGGKLDIMQMLAPNGPVYQAGTLSGNPIAMAAGISTLNVLKKANPYERFSKQTQHLKKHYLDVANKKGLPISVNIYGSMISAFFNNKEIKNFKEAQTSDTEIFSKYFWNMMSNGVFLPPSQFEACFLSTPMNDLSIEMLCNAITKSFNEL